MSFLSKQDICEKTSVASRGAFTNNLRGVCTTPLPAAARHRHKHTCSIHPGWRKSHNRHILHLPTHYSPADTMHLASHVCRHYTPLSLLIEGWGTVKALSSVHQKRTTDNFAFEGLNMHERPKRVRARGSTIVWPPHPPHFQLHDAHTHTWKLCPRVTDGRMLANVHSELPLLSSTTLTPEDSWEADIPSSQLSEENKRACGTPPTHTCMCGDTCNPPPPPQKTLSMQLLGWSCFSSMGLPDSRGVSNVPETLVEGESQGDNLVRALPWLAHWCWDTSMWKLQIEQA